MIIYLLTVMAVYVGHEFCTRFLCLMIICIVRTQSIDIWPEHAWNSEARPFRSRDLSQASRFGIPRPYRLDHVLCLAVD